MRSLLTGIAVFRWLAWAWMAVLLVVNRSELDRARAPGRRSPSPSWGRPCW